jgi:hypothetical protein
MLCQPEYTSLLSNKPLIGVLSSVLKSVVFLPRIDIFWIKWESKLFNESQWAAGWGQWSTAQNLLARKNCSTQFCFYSTVFEQTINLISIGRQPYLTGFWCRINWIRSVSLLVKIISTARIANGQQRFWKMSTAWHNL